MCPGASPRVHRALCTQVRELIQDFYHSRYAACLRNLEALRPQLLLDLHLHPHAATLYKQVGGSDCMWVTQVVSTREGVHIGREASGWAVLLLNPYLLL